MLLSRCKKWHSDRSGQLLWNSQGHSVFQARKGPFHWLLLLWCIFLWWNSTRRSWIFCSHWISKMYLQPFHMTLLLLTIRHWKIHWAQFIRQCGLQSIWNQKLLDSVLTFLTSIVHVYRLWLPWEDETLSKLDFILCIYRCGRWKHRG